MFRLQCIDFQLFDKFQTYYAYVNSKEKYFL